MEKIKPLIWILLFGSLWGISETVGGDALYSSNIPLASVWLSTWGLFLMAFARVQNNRPGSSAAIGALAALFRLINAGPFICHLLGIFMLGLAFDIAATFLCKRKNFSFFKGGITGMMSAYGGYTLFALIITYVVRYETWVTGGWPKVSEHIFLSGSLLAIVSAFVVPIGFWLSQREATSHVFNSRWATRSALVFIFFLWIVGQLAGS